MKEVKPFIQKYKQTELDLSDSREQLNLKLKETGLTWEMALNN